MMHLLKVLVFVYFLSCPFLMISQTNFEISVFNSDDSTAIAGSSVILKDYSFNKTLAYGITNTQGVKNISTRVDTGIYVIKVSHLQFTTQEKMIVFVEEPEKIVKADFYLVPKSNEIEEVVIEYNRPIIVKKDTTIYNIEHWTRENDDNLEEVLNKINGIRILPNGEIEVEGKIIQKVLVDGREVTNSGASLLTKSIDPNDVKSIEVRYKEENEKIKESLLSTADYVVLDIQLKGDVDKSLFGKTRLTNGYNEDYKLGGYGNLFSLRKKANYHLFIEHDDFGEETITLRNIRNIGEEAFSKLFDLPTDFQSLSEKETFNEEIYGFDAFENKQYDVIGFSSRFLVSENLDISLGTYNSKNKLNNQAFNQREFINGDEQYISEVNEKDQLQSKTKLEFDYTSSKSKLLFNTNFIYDDLENDNSIYATNHYLLNYHSEKPEFYNNLNYELKLSDKIGIEFLSSYLNKKNSSNSNYISNDIELNNVFQANSSTIQVHQKEEHKTTLWNVQPTIHFNLNEHTLNLGNLYSSTELAYKAEAENTVTQDQIVNFSQPTNIYTTTRLKPFINYGFATDKLRVNQQLNTSIIHYPTTRSQQQSNYFGLNTFLSYDFDKSLYSNLIYRNEVSDFPLSKLMNATNFITANEFQTSTNSLIEPTREELMTFSIYKRLPKQNLNIDLAFLSGKNENNNSINLATSFISEEVRDQQKDEYQALSIQIVKEFEQFPLTISLAPEMLHNQKEYSINSTVESLKTERYMVGLKVANNSSNSVINYQIQPKFSYFTFENFAEFKQKNFQLFTTVDSELIANKLFLDASANYIHLSGTSESEFAVFNLTLTGNLKPFKYNLSLANLGNEEDFLMQTQNAFSFNKRNNTVFGRFVKLGVEYKFN